MSEAFGDRVRSSHAGLVSRPRHHEYEYAKGEDVVIDGGVAPNGRLSLASHGEGASGNDKFHIYLMAEPAHSQDRRARRYHLERHSGFRTHRVLRRLGAGFAPRAVAFRTDRHVMITMLYRVEHGRTVRSAAPRCSRMSPTVTSTPKTVDERRSVTKLSWLGSRRFVLTKRLFITSSPNLLRSLGRYGKRPNDTGDNRFFVKFSAQAFCEIVGGNRYRIVELKPGDFNQ